MLVLSRAEVEELLDLRALIDAVATAMADLSAGAASMPPRVAAQVTERDAFLAAMVGYVPSLDALAAKLVSLFPRNAGAPLPTHQAVIAAFDPRTGEPLAIMDGTAITALRTAAGSALSTRLLARENARVLAIVGTGVQARAHARAVTLAREFDEVRVAGRAAQKVRDLVEELLAQGLPARAAGSCEDAIRGADVVCAATHSLVPVVRGRWLSAGTHVTSVGYNPLGRELDDEAVMRSLVVVESRSTALAPAPAGTNDLTQPLAAGLIGQDHVHAEIGELVSGARPGRTSAEQVTLYKSVGVGVQDAAAAAIVVANARARGAGTELPI